MHVNESFSWHHYNDVMMGATASQITSLTKFYSTVYLSADQRKHQSSTSLAFVREIHQWPVNSPHKAPVTRKMFPFDDVIMMLQTSAFWMMRTVPCSVNTSGDVVENVTPHVCNHSSVTKILWPHLTVKASRCMTASSWQKQVKELYSNLSGIRKLEKV